MLRKPELRRTWKDPLIHCLSRLDKANLCTNQHLLFGHKINRDHSYKKQQPSYYLHARFKQRKTLHLTFTCFFHTDHQTGFVRLYSFVERSDDQKLKQQQSLPPPENLNVSKFYFHAKLARKQITF